MKNVWIIRLAAAAAALAAVLSLAGCGALRGRRAPAVTEPAAQIADSSPAAEDADIEEHPSAQTFREATLYYVSDEGFVVPVKKLIPWEEGIAKACLGYITSSSVNDAEAAKLGLRTVLPAGTEIGLAISDGEARLDLVNLSPLPDAEAESAMLTALVDTLTEFSTVETVTVTREGRGGSLENGTQLPVGSKRRALNAEDTELAVSSFASSGTLWFPNLSGAVTVPVTRYFGSQPSLYTRVSALIDGPKSERLMCCFPKGTLLLGATLENGVVTVNLSEDFKAVADTYGMYSLAYRTLEMTLAEDHDFSRLVIQVNGSVYAPEEVKP